MAQNEQYWIDRANRRMDGYQISAIKQARIINRSYNQTCSYVQSEIAKILRHIGDEDSLAYEYRMRRLNALLANTRKMMQELYGITLNDTTEFLRNIIPEAYYHTIFDVAQGAGEQPVFSAVNTRLIDKIVNDQWSGKNYSQRIWWNTSKLSEDVQQLLTTAAMSGESIYKTSRRLSERFGESMNNSVRLIRTETTYACNQAEMASYKSLDIDHYKFVATLDTRTSTICQKLDGKVFETKDAQAGKNLPSMHPNCRSTTIPYFEDGMPEIRAARDKDGNRIKVPADMTYPEWYEKYIKPSEGGNGSQKPSAPSKGKDAAKSGNGSQKPQKTLDSKPAEINIPAPDNGQPEYTDTPIPKNVHNSSVTDKVTAEERKELLSRDKVSIAENTKTAKTAEKASVVEETSGFKQAKATATNVPVHKSSIDNVSQNDIIINNKALYPDTLAGVKRGKPMSFEEADSGNVNPNYGQKGYDTNCQTCTIVNEARRRGYDVEALPNTPNSMAEKLSHQYTMAWINPETGKKPEFIVDKSKDTPKKYLEFMHSTIQPNERYIIGFTWKGKGNSGHIVNLDINENGELRIKDNQRGTKERSEWIGDKAVMKYLKQMKWSETLSGYKMPKVPKMLRIDNLQFEPDVVKKIMKGREG